MAQVVGRASSTSWDGHRHLHPNEDAPMTFFRPRTPSPLSLVLVALATAACQEPAAPPTTDGNAAIGSPSNFTASSAVMLKAKKNGPGIESLQLSTTSLELNAGIAATYSVTLNNPFGRGSRTY